MKYTEYYSWLSPKKDVITCPIGQKDSNLTNGIIYNEKCSPDKGAVCLVLPALNLILVNVHLAGTNEYNVPESYFDKKRTQQLERITEKN